MKSVYTSGSTGAAGNTGERRESSRRRAGTPPPVAGAAVNTTLNPAVGAAEKRFWAADGVGLAPGERVSNPFPDGLDVSARGPLYELFHGGAWQPVGGQNLAEGRDGAAALLCECGQFGTDLLESLRTEIARHVEHGGSIRSLLSRCVGSIATHPAVALARVWLLAKPGRDGEHHLRLAAGAGLFPGCVGPQRRLSLREPTVGAAAREQRAVCADFGLEKGDRGRLAWTGRAGIRSLVAYPLLDAGKVLGVLAVYGREPLPSSLLDLLQETAGLLSLRLAHLETLETLRRQTVLLERAQRDAEHGSRLESDFIARVSHEIRTPLNGVIGMAELLLDTPLSTAQRTLAGSLRTSGEMLLSIINEILDFAKMEAGKLVIDNAPFDLLGVVEEVTEMLTAPAHEKGLDLVVRCAPGTPRRLVGDSARLRQVLTNLVGNAIKFTPTGHIIICVACEGQTPEGARIHVEVQDSGIGISRRKQKHVFSSFTQAETSTTRRYGGTGLGLSISRQLVDLMGGSIGLESRLGQGSTFWFTLNLPLAGDAPVVPEAPADLAGKRVLTVIEHPDHRGALCDFMTAWEMRVEAPGGTQVPGAPGEVALPGPGEILMALRDAVADGDPFEAAILDQRVLGAEWEAIARAIKADATLRQTALIMLAGAVRLVDETPRRRKTDPRPLPLYTYLMKPAREAPLLEALRTALAETGHLPERTAPAVRPTGAEAAQPGAGARVLVVEDNAVNQTVATLRLEKLGCLVEVASNGREAVRRLEKSSYDLVFMDCLMPEMDGYQATREIRKRESRSGEKGRHTPIVAMTANILHGDREKCFASGMDDFLPKPIREEDLRRALATHLPAAAPLAAGPLSKSAGQGPAGAGARRGRSGTPRPARRRRQLPGAAEVGFDAEIDAAIDALSPRFDAPANGGIDAQTPAIVAPLFDRAALLDLIGGDEEFLSAFAELFKVEFPRLKAAIREAVARSQGEALRQAAHELKGILLSLNATPAAELAGRVEALGVQERFDEAMPLVNALESQVDQIRDGVDRAASSAGKRAA